MLFDSLHDAEHVVRPANDVFHDLHLDDIIGAITAGREEYELAPVVSQPVDRVATVNYRQGVFRDLDGTALLSEVVVFAEGMRAMRRHLARARESSSYRLEQQRWFLDAVQTYCAAVRRFAEHLADSEASSAAFTALSQAFLDYVRSDDFMSLTTDAIDAGAALEGVRYCVNVHGDQIRVSRYEHEPDYSAEVLDAFAKFRQGDVDRHAWRAYEPGGLNHITAQIADLVAKLVPEPFSKLAAFCEAHADFHEPFVVRFDREVQFYVAYLDYMNRFRSAGLSFCYPDVSGRTKEVALSATFDLALADRLLRDGEPVVCNDFFLHHHERIIVVTGPNQGGKTTLARTFGQVHHLGRLGCPVPGVAATLMLYDQLFTLFEREEDLATQSGKLQDDLRRIHEILQAATSRSIVILNEIFTSTALHDARLLGTKILQQLIDRDLVGVYVTFVDELASLDPSVVSMVATVLPDDPTQRTYQVVRKPADGLAYAVALAQKYGLSYDTLRRRVPS